MGEVGWRRLLSFLGCLGGRVKLTHACPSERRHSDSAAKDHFNLSHHCRVGQREQVTCHQRLSVLRLGLSVGAHRETGLLLVHSDPFT